MQGQMYVERLTSSSGNEVRPHPIIFGHGATRTGAVSPHLEGYLQPPKAADKHTQDWLTKLDGNPGWADNFSRYHEVYLVDAPFRGRSA